MQIEQDRRARPSQILRNAIPLHRASSERDCVLLCRQLDLFGGELLAVDGTRIKVVNNKDRNFTRASLTQFIKAADAKIDAYLQRLDKSDTNESATGGSRPQDAPQAARHRRQGTVQELKVR